MRRTEQLKQLLAPKGLSFLMEAHNGLSSKIVEEAGFEGVWASGLSMSAAMGVRDNSEASWTQVLEVLEFMSDATTLPILVDGDTGYGNFNNMRRLVRKLEQRSIAGVCIEDKLFPKTNSFIDGGNQALADIDEFCGKIKAGKDSQADDDFCIVARTEAFITGWGLEEALKRAEAYAEAGADGLLIHSKRSDADEVLSFMRKWDTSRCPVVIVPTMYYSVPTEVFAESGISLVIWANHLLRSAATAMQKTARRIHQDRSLLGVEEAIVPVEEIFRLQGAEELKLAEERYLPAGARSAHCIVLAASRGEALGSLTEAKPKCMIAIEGIPLIERLVSILREGQIKDISIVRGYCKQTIALPDVVYHDNDAYDETGELVSLGLAREEIAGNTLICYGDIIFKKYMLSMCFDLEDDIVIVVDSSRVPEKKGSEGTGKKADLVQATQGDSLYYYKDQEAFAVSVGSHTPLEKASGEWIGLLRATETGSEVILKSLEELESQDGFERMGIPDLLNHVVGNDYAKVRVLYVKGDWLDIDDIEDVARMHSFVLDQ